jgi:hypothetical protein
MTQVWMCASCHSLNEATAKRCYRCRTARTTGEYVDATGKAGAPGTQATAPRDPSLIGGIFFGLVAAVAATGLWYWFDLNMSRGFFYMSEVVGIAIAVGVLLGGRGRTSFPLVIFSVLLTLVAIAAGEYLLISHVLAVESGQATNALAVAQPEDVAAALPKLIAETPLRPVLWVVALVTAFLVPWRGLVGD